MLLLEEFYIRVPFIDLFNQDVSLSLKRNGYTFKCSVSRGLLSSLNF